MSEESIPPLVALTGRKRSGKDSAAAHLVRRHGFARVAFADPIKCVLTELDPYLDGTRGPAGYADAEAERLVRTFRTSMGRWVNVRPTQDQAIASLEALAPYMRGTVRLQDLLIAASGDWDRLKEGSEVAPPEQVAEIRRLQQRLGTEAVRQVYGDSTWTDVALDHAAGLRAQGMAVVITDCRLDVEASAVREVGGRIIRIDRPALSGPTDPHVTEAGVSEHLVDAVITNDGTLADLATAIDRELAG